MAKGRAAMMRSWARRSFDAATIFIALVICCVFFTARTRRRRSIRDGMRQCALRGRCLPRGELSGEFLHGVVERTLHLVVELLLLGNAAQHLRVTRFQEA